MKKNKTFLIIILCTSLIFMVGWKIKPVRLLTNQKLIDLQLTITDADPGQNGNPETNNIGDTQDVSDEEDSSSSSAQSNTHEVTVISYDIKVSDTTVIFNNNSYLMSKEEGVTALRRAIISKNNTNVKFVLVDAYAEAHSYRTVYNMLLELRESDHIVFSERVDD